MRVSHMLYTLDFFRDFTLILSFVYYDSSIPSSGRPFQNDALARRSIDFAKELISNASASPCWDSLRPHSGTNGRLHNGGERENIRGGGINE
jgi:hypothetical protein